MKKHLQIIILLIVAIVGFSLLLYPIVGKYINSFHQSQSVAQYSEATSKIDKNTLSNIKSNTKNYNKKLAKSRQVFINGEPKSDEYTSLLNVDDEGMMGYIEIDKIGMPMPIYHGTSDKVLSNGIGHLEGSSLPLGEIGTHCVLTGHRGVPSSELFTNLDKVELGDLFTITVLDEVLVYEVDKISIVEPDDDSQLKINQNEDYVTLFTCTPYAVNTHRLLVRGTRIETKSFAHTVTAEAIMVDSNLVAVCIAVPIIAALVLGIVVNKIITRRRYK